MKQIISILIISTLLCSCGGSNSKTVTEAKQLAAAIKQMQPGGIASTEGGWTMSANIGGKNWTASSLIPPERAGKIFGENNGENISLPYQRGGMVVGKKIKFSTSNAVDMARHDDVALWEGYTGEMEITKAEGEWVEGTFFFTGSAFGDPSKTLEVTDGFFRISTQQKR